MHLRGAYANLRRHSNRVFLPFGMTSDQYVLLAVLAHDKEATQQELVRRCYSDTATMGTMLSLLEAKGLVTRKPHPRDGRAWRVELSPAGRMLTEKMRRSSSRLRAELATLFEEQELRILLELLERLAGAMRSGSRRGKAVSTRRPKTALK